MNPNSPPDNGNDLVRRIDAGHARIVAQDPRFSGRWVLVAIRPQHLFLLDGKAVLASWPVSTAAAGMDNREGSGGTPAGLHRIARKVGHGKTWPVWPHQAVA